MWVYLTREYLQAGSKPDIPPADIIANRARGNPELVGCVPLLQPGERRPLSARASARTLTILLLLYFESSSLPAAGERETCIQPQSRPPATTKNKFSPFCARVCLACAESFWQSRLADRCLHLHLSRSLNGIVPKLPSQWCLLATDYIKCIIIQ
jgi:hypothetical protein